MTYQVLARRLRPQRFADVVGQDHVTRTLQAAIAAGRVAHAFLFTGPRGVGKTTTARLLAKALNCEQGRRRSRATPAPTARRSARARLSDVLEIDGASHTQVDKMRDLMETVAHLPLKSRFKIFIIDEVHMLSSHSFNALLKTLEEPPPHVKFIFATTSRTRCWRRWSHAASATTSGASAWASCARTSAARSTPSGSRSRRGAGAGGA